jgi:hypothetical protein
MLQTGRHAGIRFDRKLDHENEFVIAIQRTGTSTGALCSSRARRNSAPERYAKACGYFEPLLIEAATYRDEQCSTLDRYRCRRAGNDIAQAFPLAKNQRFMGERVSKMLRHDTASLAERNEGNGCA